MAQLNNPRWLSQLLLLVDEPVVLLPQCLVLIKLRRWFFEDTLEERDRFEACKELEGCESVYLVILLCHHQLVTCDTICVPPTNTNNNSNIKKSTISLPSCNAH